MSTAKISGETFLSLLRQSALIDIDQLRRLWKEVQEGGIDATDGAAIAEEFVRRGAITRWQADKLLQGKHKGFFIGKYRLLSHLGKGGMSSVYLAEHVLMRRRVAIKVLPSNRVDDSSYLQRFHREAQAVASLDHRNIVRAYDVDQEGAVHFLVMEYVPGQSMQELVAKQGPLPPVSAAEYIRQAAEGLSAAHKAGLVHRDIKPGNLLVDEKGTVKLLDLGLAMFFGEADKDTASLTIAHEEKVLGTADYLAPEQALDSHSVDIRADIYSLGGTLYFCLTGFPPFPEGTVAQRLMAHQAKQPKPISSYRSDVPDTLAAVIDRMMAKKPDERYQTAKETSAALFQWLAQNGGDAWMKMSATASVASPASGGPGSSQALPKVEYAPPASPSSERSGSNLFAASGAGGPPGGSTVVQKEAPRPPAVEIVTPSSPNVTPAPAAPTAIGVPDFSAFGASHEPTEGGFGGLDELTKAIAGGGTPAVGPKSSSPSLPKAKPTPAAAAAPAAPVPVAKPPMVAPSEDPPTVIAKRAPVPTAPPTIAAASGTDVASVVVTPPVVAPTASAKSAVSKSAPPKAVVTAPIASEGVPDFSSMMGSATTEAASPAAGFDLAAAFGAAALESSAPTEAAVPPKTAPVKTPVVAVTAPVVAPAPQAPAKAPPIAKATPVAKAAPDAPARIVPKAAPVVAAPVPPPAPVSPPTPVVVTPSPVEAEPDNPFANFGFGGTESAKTEAAPFDPALFASAPAESPATPLPTPVVAAPVVAVPVAAAPVVSAPVVSAQAPVEAAVVETEEPEAEFEAEAEVAPLSKAKRGKPAGLPQLPMKLWLAIGGAGLAIVLVGAWMFFGGSGDKPTKTVKKGGKAKTTASGEKRAKPAGGPFNLKRELKVGPGEKFSTVGAALADIKAEFASRKEDFEDAKRRVARTIKLTPSAALSEAIVLDESFPPGVTISGDPAAPAALAPSGSGPAIKVSGTLERVTIENLKIDATGKPTAIELSGFLNQLKLSGLEITGFGKTAIVVDGLTAYAGQRDRALIEGVVMRGSNPESTGVLLKKGAEDPAHLRVSKSMFLGPMAQGVLAQASLVDLQIVECVFGQNTTGVRLEGEGRQWKDLVFAHNTFHKGQRGVVFTHMPAATSDGIAFYNNLFLELGGPAVNIENGFQEGTFLTHFTKQGGGAQHNWTDADEPAAPVAGVFNLFRSAGKWGAKDLKFVSTESASPDYLKPVEGSPLAKVGRPASAEFTLERVGAK